MSPRELRLRQRIDDLMDRHEAEVVRLRAQVERAKKQNRRLESRIAWLRQSRDGWRRRCGYFRHSHELALARKRYERAKA